MTINTHEGINCFNELSKINDTTDLYELIPKRYRPSAVTVPTPVNAFHQSLFSFASTSIHPVPSSDSSPQIKKAKHAFLKIVIKWRDELSNYYWKVHLVPSKLEVFQASIAEVMELNKLPLFRQKLCDLGLKSKFLHNAVTQLEQEMESISNSPIIKEIKLQNPVTKSPPLRNKTSPIFSERYSVKRSRSENNLSSLIKQPVDDDERVFSDGEEITFDDEKNLNYEFQAQSILNQCKVTCKDWKKNLIKLFSDVSCPHIINCIAVQASFLQISAIINSVLGEENQYSKLGHLIRGLDLNTLNMLIYKLDKHQLMRVNEVISDDHYTDIDSIKAYFEGRVRDWIDQCNKTKEKIDNLCNNLRFNVTGCNLSRQDLDIINAYTDEVDKLLSISTKIGWLIKNIITNVEWMHVSTDGVQKEYLTFRTRLTEKHPYAGRVSGCVWGIIYRQSFERLFEKEIKSRLEPDYNEEDATKTFADWVITHPLDYRKVGLLGDIADGEFAKLKQDTMKVKHIAKCVLNELGIEKIKHWKEKEIFNFTLFKEYLAKRDVQEIVNQTVKRLLACD